MSYTASIIITTFQRPELLRWGLSSLVKQQIPFPFETIIVNDGLPDATEAVCAEFKERLNIRYLFSGARNLAGELMWRVPGFAFNIGVRQAQGEVLILSCAEMFHLNDTISTLTYPLLGNPKLMVIPEGKDDQDGSFLNHLIETAGNFNPKLFMDYPELCTLLPFLMAINREEFFTIGGYDEDFTGLAYDDCDLVNRLQRDGCKYHPTGARTIHLYHPRYAYDKFENEVWNYNKTMYYAREEQVLRNQGREWGRL